MLLLKLLLEKPHVGYNGRKMDKMGVSEPNWPGLWVALLCTGPCSLVEWG